MVIGVASALATVSRRNAAMMIDFIVDLQGGKFMKLPASNLRPGQTQAKLILKLVSGIEVKLMPDVDTTRALSVLSNSLDRYRNLEDIRSLEVFAALDLLAARATVKWPFVSFGRLWKMRAPKTGK